MLDHELLVSGSEHLRVLLHELFHFLWVRLGNQRRIAWESVLVREWAAGARGEAGWSAEWRKEALKDSDVRGRTRKWREYCCESFCDTGAWVLGGSGREVTLAKENRRRRADIIRTTVKNTRYVAIGVAAVLGIVACGPTRPARKAVRDDKDRKHAPEFALKDASGKVVHLSDYRGKVVLLDFWATWCGPCNLEVPWFTDFERKYKDRGFEVLGVSMDDEGWKAIAPFVNAKKINYRIVLGDDKTGDQYGGIEALPTTFVLDRDGRIASVHIGVSERKEFEDAIEKLLQEPVDSVRGAAVRPNES